MYPTYQPLLTKVVERNFGSCVFRETRCNYKRAQRIFIQVISLKNSGKKISVKLAVGYPGLQAKNNVTGAKLHS